MKLFGKKANGGRRCPECKFYMMIEGYGYCAKDVAEKVNVRLLSTQGAKRQLVRCPKEMTCADWIAGE
jgi:hypothetical protein